ncbi:sensor domain-containing protein [Exilibacterium tricleocarpae]|nr:EAL domain-containing protein [Exilibacterium tricleocarpae]
MIFSHKGSLSWRGAGSEGDTAETEIGAGSEADYFRQLAENLTDLVVTTDTDLNLTYVSPSAERVLGYSAPALRRFYQGRRRCGGDLLERVTAFFGREMQRVRSRRGGGRLSVSVAEFDIVHRRGQPLCLEINTSALQDRSGRVLGLLCICRDITARKRAADELALASKVFQNSLTGIYITGRRGEILQVNRAFSRITGFSPEEALGRAPQLIDLDHYAEDVLHTIAENLERRDYWEGELRCRHRDGHSFPAWVALTVLRETAGRETSAQETSGDKKGDIINTISTFTDITEKKSSQVKIQRLAYFDPLSGLPNRSLFNDRLARALSRAQRTGTRVALMFLDLDRFKAVNDSLGHALGDALLCQVAQRLRDCVRSEDTVARMGGDEFTVILGELADRQQAVTAAAHIAEKIRRLLSEPFHIRGREVFTSTSIGIAFYPSDGAEPRTLLQNADTAMYYAKSAGKNNFQFYTKAMNAKAMERMELENALHRAVRQTQFELHYQPILDSRSGAMVGVEALVRWQHPERGLVLPDAFINIAEESGTIKVLGAWVLRRACQQLVTWERHHQRVGRLAVNISARQFVEGHILQTLRDVVDRTGVDPTHLELELTESALMQDHRYSVEVLEAIKSLGVRVAIDDFGSGYSSLNYLKKFPIDAIKIDQAFVKGLPSQEDKRIIQAIIALAHSLGLKVVAEGVETSLQLECVRALGCEEVQGFLLGKPVPAQQFAAQAVL